MAHKGQRGSRPTGRLAAKVGAAAACIAFGGGLLGGVFVLQNLGGAVTDSAARQQAFWVAVFAAVAAGLLGLVAGWIVGNGIAARIGSLAHGVAKIGRGNTDVKIRAAGNDELTGLGRSLQALATDVQELVKEQEKGGVLPSHDPQVRALRDRTLPKAFPAVPGFELDGALSAGSRGGLDWYDVALPAKPDGKPVVWLVSGEGNGAVAVVAAKLARDELARAFHAGGSPRQALLHANKAMKQALPAGACAKATLLELDSGPEGGGLVRLHQAGARSPLLICQRGQVLELAAEGIALGLDDGPVFERSLQPQEVAASPGTRFVLCNEAALRTERFLELLGQHSPRHTAMFMNMVLGGLEQDAGEDGLREDVVLVTAKKAGQP